MEKDIGLSREELIEMLKKSEARNAALAAEVSSLRNGAADSKARIAGYEKDLGILRDEKKKAEKKISELSHASDQLRAYGDEEHFLRTVLERYLVANKVLTRELIRQLYANSRSEKTSELAKKGICVSPAADHPSDSPDTVKSETEGRKRGRREGTVDFDCIPGKTETVDTAPSKTPVCESCGVTMDEKGAQEFYKLSYVPGYFRKTRYIVHCYVCPHCGKRSDTSEKAEDAYGLSGCTPSLGAFLAYLSYGAYLPRNRLRDVFAQSGFPLSKTLIVRYCAMTAKVFAPLAARMKEDLRKAHVVHIDETPYNCLGAENRTNYFWAAVTGASEPSRIMLYCYENDRKYEHAKEILGDGFPGTVVSDQYGAYAGFGHLAYCYSHLERPLIAFLADYPEDSRKDRDFLEVQELVSLLKQAFGAEKRLKGLSPEERKESPLIHHFQSLLGNLTGRHKILGLQKNNTVRSNPDKIVFIFGTPDCDSLFVV
jgi:transposase